MPNPVIALAKQLIQIPSITPHDHGCQVLLTERLQNLGFRIQSLPNGNISNFWAEHGEGDPLFVFAGHTDVVPTGEESAWEFPPFAATLQGDQLHGRGAADMKGSLAAMIIAIERFVSDYPTHSGTIGLLITSAEESTGELGTPVVLDYLKQQKKNIDYCLVGEPTSDKQLGDTLKIGRRGSLNGVLTVHGKQGHVAYPELASNPIHEVTGALNELCQHTWDQGSEHFPPTRMQISNINAGTGAENVIPGTLTLQFNFRFSPESTVEQLQQAVENIFRRHSCHFEIDWALSGLPFYTHPDTLIHACTQSIQKHKGLSPTLSTSGGTSDGRFIAPTGAQVVELGPCNHTIHQVNEWISASDLLTLETIYYEIIQRVLMEKST